MILLGLRQWVRTLHHQWETSAARAREYKTTEERQRAIVDFKRLIHLYTPEAFEVFWTQTRHLWLNQWDFWVDAEISTWNTGELKRRQVWHHLLQKMEQEWKPSLGMWSFAEEQWMQCNLMTEVQRYTKEHPKHCFSSHPFKQWLTDRLPQHAYEERHGLDYQLYPHFWTTYWNGTDAQSQRDLMKTLSKRHDLSRFIEHTSSPFYIHESYVPFYYKHPACPDALAPIKVPTGAWALLSLWRGIQPLTPEDMQRWIDFFKVSPHDFFDLGYIDGQTVYRGTWLHVWAAIEENFAHQPQPLLTPVRQAAFDFLMNYLLGPQEEGWKPSYWNDTCQDYPSTERGAMDAFCRARLFKRQWLSSVETSDPPFDPAEPISDLSTSPPPSKKRL